MFPFLLRIFVLYDLDLSSDTLLWRFRGRYTRQSLAASVDVKAVHCVGDGVVLTGIKRCVDLAFDAFVQEGRAVTERPGEEHAQT